MRTRLLIAALLTALAAAFAPVASAQTFSFTDGVNDAPAGAPDLTTTSAAIDTGGLITWKLSTAVAGAFGSGTAVSIRIDSDNSTLTGSGGADYAIVVVDGYIYLMSWNGSTFVSVPNAPGLSANLGFPETVTLHASAIGSPRTVSFQILAFGQAPYSASTADVSPNGGGWWSFDTSTPNAAPTSGTSTTTPVGPAAPAPPDGTAPAAPTATTAAPAPAVPAAPATPAASSAPTAPTGQAAPTGPPTAKLSAPMSAAFSAPSQTAKRLLEADQTSWHLDGKHLVVTTHFSRSVTGARGTCSFTAGSRKLGSLPVKPSGHSVTCRGVFRGRVPRKFRALVTVTLKGSTVRVPLQIAT
jgi:hypothetical protein